MEATERYKLFSICYSSKLLNHQLAHPVNLSSGRDEVSGEEGSDCGDVFKVSRGGVGNDDEVLFDEGTCQTLAFLTPGAHLVHPDSYTVQHRPVETKVGMGSR